MAVLFACLGIGKGTWGHLARLIAGEPWDRIVLLSSDFGKENFKPEKECEWILLSNRAGFQIIKEAVKEKLPEGELCVSLASGSGKEHMAVIVALKETKREYKIVTLTGDGIKYY